jgi:hypothetical protein
MSPILCAPSPLNQTPAREFVDQEHHPTGKNTEKPGQPLLIQAGRSGYEPKYACVGWGDAEVYDSVGEPAGGMRAELCQEKCCASRSVFSSTHG